MSAAGATRAIRWRARVGVALVLVMAGAGLAVPSVHVAEASTSTVGAAAVAPSAGTPGESARDAAIARARLSPALGGGGAVLPSAPLPACTYPVYTWPSITDPYAGGVPCYIAHPAPGIQLDGPANARIMPNTTANMSVSGFSSPANDVGAWLLYWYQMFDYWPLMRGSNGVAANDLSGYQFLFSIPPQITVGSNCHADANGPLYGRWVPSCSVTFGKGPYYGTPAGQTIPYTVLTAATQANGGGWTSPIVTNGGGTTGPVWRWQDTFAELPILLEPSPYAGFTTSDVASGTQFTDTTKADLAITSWAWNFGDPASGANNTAAVQNPIHRYSGAGPYHATLTVTVADGQTDTWSIDVSPNQSHRPTAAFTANKFSVGQYQLVSTSTDPNGSALTETWSVAGAALSSTTGPAVTATWGQPGTWDATLTVTNADGYSDSTTQQITIDAPTLATSVSVFDGPADVSPADTMTVHVVVSASGDGVGDLTGVHFDPSVGTGVQVSSNVNLFTVDSGPAPALPATLAPGDSVTLTYHLTAGDVGTGALLTKVDATDGAGNAVSADASANVKVSHHALKVTVTPSKTGFKLKPDPSDPEKVLPETIDVDVAVENVSTGNVNNVAVAQLDMAGADPQHPYTPFPLTVVPPNQTEQLGTIAAGAVRHVVRHVQVNGDGSFKLQDLVTSSDGNTLGAGQLDVGVTQMLVMEIDGPDTRQTVVGGTVIIRGRFKNITNDKTVAITDPMKVFRSGNLIGGGMIADGNVDISDGFPRPLMGKIAPGKALEFQVRFTTARPSASEYQDGTWNTPDWTAGTISFAFSPRAAVQEDDGTWSALTSNSVSVSLPGGPPASPYPGSIAFKGPTGFDISIDATQNLSPPDVVTRAGAAAFGMSIGALEAAQSRLDGLASLIVNTPQFVLDSSFRDQQIAKLMPDLRNSEALNYLAEMAVWLPQASITEITQSVGQQLHDSYDAFTATVTGGIPHPQSTTVSAISGIADQYIATLQANWRQGNPNAIIDSFRPIGQTVGGVVTDVALQEAAFEGVAALMRAPKYLAEASARWKDASTIEKMKAALPPAAQQTIELKAGEVSKSNFPLLEEAYDARRPLSDVELGVGTNSDGAGISAEVIARNRQYSKDTGSVIVVLPNESGVAAALDSGKALGKIENIKPKSLAQIEMDVFGGRAEDLNRVVLRNLKLTEAEADAAIDAAISAGKITPEDRVIAKSIWKRRNYEWAKFKAGGAVDKATLQPKIDPATGRIAADEEGIGNLTTYDLNGKIPNQFRGADNGLSVNGPQQLLDFKLEYVSDDYVVPLIRHPKTGLMVPSTGDVDGIFIGLANGLGLAKTDLEAAYASLMDVYNHPFSDTWLAAADKKLGIFSKYFTELFANGATGEGAPLVMFKNGEAYAVKINPWETRFDPVTNRAYIAWEGAPVSVDPSLMSQIFQPMAPIPAPVYFLGLPATFMRMFLPKAANGSTPPLPTSRKGKVVRLNAAGQVESWTLAGGWVADPSVQASAVTGDLAIVPETLASGATGPGATEIPITSQTDMAMAGAWFQVGDVVVLDPGGPNQETATISGFGSLIFDHPLTKPHAAGEMIAILPSASASLPPAAGYVPLVPARLLETRSGVGLSTVDHQSEGIGVRGAGSVTELVVAGRGGVGANPAAVVVNVAVVDARGPGFVTVYPCGQDRPNAANLNYVAGQTIANAIVAKVGDGGAVCVFTYGAVDLAVDVNGWYPTGAGYDPVVPARVLETRTGPGLSTVDHVGEGIGALGAGTVTELSVAGRGGVAADASAVVLNIAVVDARTPGFVTVYPCGQDRPNAANLNYVAGQTVANAVVAKVGAGGKVCLFTYGTVDLAVDVNGWYPTVTDYVPLVPARVLETRSGAGLATVDHQSEGIGVRSAGSVTELVVAGRGGVAANAAAVVLNVAVIDAKGPGYVTVYPCGQDRPNAANLNYVAGDTRPNAVVAQVGDGGKVCLFTYAAADLAVDVQGAFAGAS